MRFSRVSLPKLLAYFRKISSECKLGEIGGKDGVVERRCKRCGDLIKNETKMLNLQIISLNHIAVCPTYSGSRVWLLFDISII